MTIMQGLFLSWDSAWNSRNIFDVLFLRPSQLCAREASATLLPFPTV